MGLIGGVISAVSVAVYWMCKIYFMFMAFYYVWAILNNEVNTFTHVTGIVGIAFLFSNIWWYLGRWIKK